MLKKSKLESVRLWFINHTRPQFFQVVGLIHIILAYFAFGFEKPLVGWLQFLLPVGIIELLLLWVWKERITSFCRDLLPKSIDNIK